MKVALLCILTSALALLPLNEARAETELTISAASSLKGVLEEIKTLYATKSAVRINYNWAASGILKTQIEQGAPVDIFLSASRPEMESLENQKFLTKGGMKKLIKNQLVLVQNTNAKRRIRSLVDLKDKGLKKIAIGNPLTVPVGRYAKEVLDYYKLFDAVKERVVMGESARQIVDYTNLNEIDAAFLFATDILNNKKIRLVMTIPQGAHSDISYYGGVIKTTKGLKEAEAYLSFLEGNEAKLIFKKWGFLL